MKLFATRLVILSLGFALLSTIAEAKLPTAEWSKLSKKARRAAKAGDGSTVASLISEIAADDTTRAVELIGQLSALQSAEVYNAAKDAFASMSEEKTVSHMCQKLSKGSGKWTLRVLLADAFAERSDSASIEALNSALSDRRAEVIRAVVDSILARRDKSSVGPLIGLLERYEKKKTEGLNVEKVREGLTALTGENFEAAIDWKGWWEPRKDEFNMPERPTSGGKKKEIGGTVSRKPKFFGSEIKSRRIVFIIDVSGSMQASDPAPPAGGRERTPTGAGPGGKPAPKAPSRVRLERAKFHLNLALKALPKGARFSIIAYHGGGGVPPAKGQKILPQAKKLDWLDVWSTKLQPVSKKSVAKANQFVTSLKPRGATFTFNALRAALEILEADNVILLSDGAPNDPQPGKAPGAGGMGGMMSTDDILKEVKALNRFRRVRIDTFGFDPSSAMGGRAGSSIPGGMANPFVEFLKKLAKENGGKFTPIK